MAADYLETLCRNGKAMGQYAAKLSTQAKNEALIQCAANLEANNDYLILENEKDRAQLDPSRVAFADRLLLTPERISAMADGIRQVARLDDPVNEMVSMKQLPNGMTVGQKRVPLGVVGLIYEARPNVTVDSFALCFKAGNACILRGGSEAIHSNIALVSVLQKTLTALGHPQEMVQLITDTSRETAQAFMRMHLYVDVLIPRGGAGLIQSAIENSTIPVIQTGVGNCHIYVDDPSDFDKAVPIIINAKAQRPSVCNACEKLLVHEKIADSFLPLIGRALAEAQVAIRGDERVCTALDYAKPATEEDWSLEYLDLIIAIKVVSGIQEAMNHIAQYGTGHSEAILTESYSRAQQFLKEVDAAAVYVNASTRFTDGGEFGLGAEIGISTQKLHARGPMGLQALTSTKFIIYGSGQIRV